MGHLLKEVLTALKGQIIGAAVVCGKSTDGSLYKLIRYHLRFSCVYFTDGAAPYHTKPSLMIYNTFNTREGQPSGGNWAHGGNGILFIEDIAKNKNGGKMFSMADAAIDSYYNVICQLRK